MSVPCPRCGRDYDITLFQFGRTLHCTCGTRVVLEPRVRLADPGRGRRFLADAMLGRLARWLRIIGCDTAFEGAIEDAELARRALEEERVLLTRDRALAREWSLPEILVLDSDSLRAQLRQVVQAFDLDWRGRAFSRCSRCNAPLEPAQRSRLEGRVPERVLREQPVFLACPECARVYWAGSHTDRMRNALEDWLGGPAEEPEPVRPGRAQGGE